MKNIFSKTMKKIMSPRATTSKTRKGLSKQSSDVFSKGSNSPYSMENRIQRQQGAKKMKSYDLTQHKASRSEWNMWNTKPRRREHALNMKQKSIAIKAGTALKLK